MYYLAYSPELDLAAFARWARGQNLPWLEWNYLGAAMLREHNLAFARYDAESGGGVASVQPAVGKRVAGAVYEIEGHALDHLERFANDFDDSELSQARVRQSGVANRRSDNQSFDVITFTDPVDARNYVPPASEYLQRLVRFATQHGHSHGWLMHLMSIQTADGGGEPILYDI